MVSSAFYIPGEGWTISASRFYMLANNWGTFPGVAMGLLAALALPLSYVLRPWRPYRKLALLTLWTLLLGPGLLVNTVFKQNWGRPRPRQTVLFSGDQPHYRLWEPAFDEGGHAFPSGHAAMGFVLITPALFYAARRRRRAAWLWAMLGLGSWAWLSAARMVAGAHYLSDVLWGGGMVWLTAMAGAWIIRPEHLPPPLPEDRARLRRRRQYASAGLLIAAALFGFFPYFSTKSLQYTTSELYKRGARAMHIALGDAQVEVHWKEKENFVLRSKVRAFGVPVSKLRRHWDWADTARFSVLQRGFFSVFQHEVALGLSPALGHYVVTVAKGPMVIDAWPRGWNGHLEVWALEGDVVLRLDSTEMPHLQYHGKAPWPEGLHFQQLAHPPRSGTLIVHTPQGGFRIEGQ